MVFKLLEPAEAEAAAFKNTVQIQETYQIAINKSGRLLTYSL
jgi:hypothetical protein